MALSLKFSNLDVWRKNLFVMPVAHKHKLQQQLTLHNLDASLTAV
jgi:hypothetical protein